MELDLDSGLFSAVGVGAPIYAVAAYLSGSLVSEAFPGSRKALGYLIAFWIILIANAVPITGWLNLGGPIWPWIGYTMGQYSIISLGALIGFSASSDSIFRLLFLKFRRMISRDQGAGNPRQLFIPILASISVLGVLVPAFWGVLLESLLSAESEIYLPMSIVYGVAGMAIFSWGGRKGALLLSLVALAEVGLDFWNFAMYIFLANVTQIELFSQITQTELIIDRATLFYTWLIPISLLAGGSLWGIITHLSGSKLGSWLKSTPTSTATD